jgi:hypothetical protein
MNLLNLAPDIQEEILFWSAVIVDENPMRERRARRIVAALDWGSKAHNRTGMMHLGATILCGRRPCRAVHSTRRSQPKYDEYEPVNDSR